MASFSFTDERELLRSEFFCAGWHGGEIFPIEGDVLRLRWPSIGDYLSLCCNTCQNNTPCSVDQAGKGGLTVDPVVNC